MHSDMMLLSIVFKKCNITHTIMAQAEICSNNQSLNRETLTDFIHKIFSRHSRDFRGEGNHDTVSNSSVLFCQGKFLIHGCQIMNADIWLYNDQGMRPESHQY